MATHAITREWVKWRRGPRTSQIPSSGWSHADSTNSSSVSWRSQASRLVSMPARRAWWRASMTSPYTSSWNCSLAALPIRTGTDRS